MLYDENDLLTGAENRVRNLMWTVSGDYTLKIRPDVSLYEQSRWIPLYDAVKQGAFAHYFDQNEFGLYLVKKVYCGADEVPLTQLAQLCVDAAVYRRIAVERPGVPELRRKAFSDLLEYSFEQMSQTLPGQLKIAMLRRSLETENPVGVSSVPVGGEPAAGRSAVSAVGIPVCSPRGADSAALSRQRALDEIFSLESPSTSVIDVIRVTDHLYNSLLDRGFERKHGDLEHVLAVTLEDLQEFDWSDFLKEEFDEEQLAGYLQKMNQAVTAIAEEQKEKPEKKQAKYRVIQIDEAAAAKMYSYMELNFGRSYLPKQEQEARRRRLCRGAHADCSLYYTDGILAQPVLSNAQYVNARRHAEKNRVAFRNNRMMLAHSIDQLGEELRRSLHRRMEPETLSAYTGAVVPRLLWQVGRKEEPLRLFEKTQKRNHSDFAVDVLIDASGSQRDRQSQVALQAYIIAEAFCRNRIPLQITGFCTFWDYTVLQRFRSYDDPREENQKLFNYVTSSNNRDGLAIRAVGDSLLHRSEEGKILIILSDGKPNDVIVNRPNSRNPRSYCGDYAVQDTAFEVRRLRSEGVCVLGVFTGKEQELAAEKKIFGRDFTYIRKIEGFSRVVGRYLRRLLEEDSANF